MRNRSKPQSGTPESIIFRLSSLAGLAERAACRAWIIRVVVLWFLRRAEKVLYDYVCTCAWRAAPDELIDQLDQLFAPDEAQASASEALRLAYTFRALAMILSWLVANGLVQSSDIRSYGPQPRRISAHLRALARRPVGRRRVFANQTHGRPEVRRGALPRPS